MYTVSGLSSPFGTNGHRDSHAEPISVEASKIEVSFARSADLLLSVLRCRSELGSLLLLYAVVEDPHIIGVWMAYHNNMADTIVVAWRRVI